MPTDIEWVRNPDGSKGETWNPVTGCSKISPACRHCYAERIAYRFAGMNGFPDKPHHFDITFHPERLDQPLHWRKPRTVFVNSMSDLFHQDIPIEFILRVFGVMRSAPRHTFQVLTKRSQRLLQLNDQLSWPENVWMGVSVETPAYTYRIDHLRQTDAAVKFLSLEPLLAPLPGLDLRHIHWVIVGGESGPGARPMKKAWVVDIRNQCERQAVPFFFKQWGGVNRNRSGRMLDGQIWNQLPALTSQQMSLHPT
jgi:protein gp37